VASGRILLVASTNAGKLREFAQLLGGLPLTLVPLTDFPGAPSVQEDRPTYRDNALHKAVTLAKWSQHPALADDSGLEVEALGGAPGVRSARYAGPAQDSEANIDQLLRALAEVPEERRTARFRCVIAVARPDGATLTAAGTCTGRIAAARRGSTGFGYDAVFFYPPAALTFAELPPAVKNCVSHRALACAELRGQLLGFLATDPSPGPTSSRLL
jgi:XTP/dITP diphosphohydrolase